MRLLCNPNSPTGSWVPPLAVERLLGQVDLVVVIDEAYCDFAPEFCVPLLAHHDNWLVVRTFAKSHALAGLRVGYALGHPDLIDDLSAVVESYPVDRLALAAAEAALADREHHRCIVAMVIEERERLATALRGAGWEVGVSQANFVLGRPPGVMRSVSPPSSASRGSWCATSPAAITPTGSASRWAHPRRTPLCSQPWASGGEARPSRTRCGRLSR